MTISRRGAILSGLSLAGLSAAARAAPLIATPRQSEGPFYPDRLPLDRDNDLLQFAEARERAAGTATHVFGRVRAEDGRPMPGVKVEIWQCDAFGRYHHAGDRTQGADPNFQGYGETVTDAEAGYRFRTIRPVAYGWRAPHIHFAVSGPGFQRFITQMYVEGEPLNERDSLLNRVRDPGQRAALIVPLTASDLEPDALAGRFEIVLGRNLFT